YIPVYIILLIVIIISFKYAFNTNSGNNIKYCVKKGDFIISVKTTGELQAEKFRKIEAPQGLRRVYIYKVKIAELVPEGTLVDSGDFVASLDKSEITSKLKDLESEYDKLKNTYNQAIIDTTIELSNYRDNILDIKLDLEEKKIEIQQSEFEPQAAKRKLEIGYEKTLRKYNSELRNYGLKVKQAETKVRDAFVQYKKQENWRNENIKLKERFDIYAPMKGMVIYKRERDGSKRKINSDISPNDPVIAVLPDLNYMNSITYINEIDIGKVKAGLPVIVKVDAYNHKEYKGRVVSVSNVGEELPGSTAKVFEVKIKLLETDSLLRPLMTTSNVIIANSFENVISIPQDAVFYKQHIPYVFRVQKKSILRKEIQTSDINEDFIIVENGLNEGDIILLSKPDNSDKLKFVSLNNGK
ncbi:MAG: HlyD family efflux transporter periplasmic adaptor subunit, partial [Chlorobi bacterium]|nr:HlyD family efflux transporter periplasmic adaptor subunit [Chlorobiota bacterium]